MCLEAGKDQTGMDAVTSALHALGERMMKALTWSPDAAPDWDSFRALFHKDATLVPASRPAAPISVEAFIARMQGQRDNGSLANFGEDQVSLRVHHFGNVASVFQTYRTIINNGTPGYGTSAMVWLFEDGEWRCISMAWDAQTTDKKIPDEYLI